MKKQQILIVLFLFLLSLCMIASVQVRAQTTTVSQFTVSASSPQTVGTAFTLTVTAKDADGAVVINYNGPVALSASSGSITPTSTGTGGWVNGVWSNQVTLTATGSITVAANDGNGHGGTALITVNSILVAPTVTSNPGTVDQGQTCSLVSSSVTTGTSPYMYQWLQKAPGGSFLAIGGATSSSYSFVTSVSTTIGSWSFEINVTDAVSSVITSNAASVTVASSPTVSITPTGSFTMDVGQSKTFTATASGGSGALSYQWYLDGSVVSGANSASYSYTAAGASHAVTCKVTDSASIPVTSPASNTVAVTVNSALVAPTVTPTHSTINQGQTSSLTSTSESTGTSPYMYQWLQKAPGGSYVNVGTNSASFSFVTSGSTATGVWNFELQVTDSAGTPAVVTSSGVSVTVNAAPSVSVSPTSWSMDVGQSKTFSATSSGGSGSYSSYQWSVDSTLQSGAASTFSYSPASSGSHSITVTVTDSLGSTSASSPAAMVTVAASPTVSISPAGSLTMDVGQSQTFTASASGGSGTIHYQWYLGAGMVGSDSSTYVYAASGTSASVTCKVTDSASIPVTSTASNAVSVTMNSALVAPTVTPTHSTINQGQTSSLTSTAVSTGTYPYTYQWLEKAPGAGSYSLISGVTSSIYSFVTTSSTTTGAWSFELQVIDSASTPIVVTSVVAVVIVDSNTLNNFVFSSIATQIAGTAFSITVTARGPSNNTVTSYTGTPSLTYSAGSISPTVMNAFVNGVGTTLVTAIDSGSKATITATDGSYSGTSNSFTVIVDPTATPTPTQTSTPTSEPTSSPTSTSPSPPTPTSKPTAPPTHNPSPTPLPTPPPSTSNFLAMTDSDATVKIAITGNITSSQITNATIKSNQTAKTTIIAFTISGSTTTIGYSNMTIPKASILYGTNPIIYIDGQRAPNQGFTQDANNFYVWYTMHFSTHIVTIKFVVSSVSQLTFGPLLAVGITVPEIILIYAVIAIKYLKRKPDAA